MLIRSAFQELGCKEMNTVSIPCYAIFSCGRQEVGRDMTRGCLDTSADGLLLRGYCNIGLDLLRHLATDH